MYTGIHVKYPLFLLDINTRWIFSNTILKNPQIRNSMKNRSVGSEVFHADRAVDKHDATNSRFSLFYERAWNRLLLSEFEPHFFSHPSQSQHAYNHMATVRYNKYIFFLTSINLNIYREGKWIPTRSDKYSNIIRFGSIHSSLWKVWM